jgi:hypothetical protein
MILLVLLTGTSAYQPSSAQVNVNINIGSQPIWGPTGYDYVDYYYLPDLDIYYYVPLQQWIYFNGRSWITTTVLPPQYSQYDLYRLHKVVINEKQPYLRNATYRTKYASFKGRYDQQPIRDSRDSKYYVINNHPMHNQVSANNPGRTVRPAGQPGRNGMQPQDRNGRQAAGRQEHNDRQSADRRGPR